MNKKPLNPKSPILARLKRRAAVLTLILCAPNAFGIEFDTRVVVESPRGHDAIIVVDQGDQIRYRYCSNQAVSSFDLMSYSTNYVTCKNLGPAIPDNAQTQARFDQIFRGELAALLRMKAAGADKINMGLSAGFDAFVLSLLWHGSRHLPLPAGLARVVRFGRPVQVFLGALTVTSLGHLYKNSRQKKDDSNLREHLGGTTPDKQAQIWYSQAGVNGTFGLSLIAEAVKSTALIIAGSRGQQPQSTGVQ